MAPTPQPDLWDAIHYSGIGVVIFWGCVFTLNVVWDGIRAWWWRR